MDSQLITMILEALPSLGLKQDEQTYEILLSMHATTRSFSEMQELVKEMETEGVEFSSRSLLALVKSALQNGDFEEAKRRFGELKGSKDAQGQWVVPRHVVAQVVELACKEHQLNKFMSELSEVPLPEEAINEMLTECVRLDDSELA